MTNETTNYENKPNNNGNTVAIVSYIAWIGWIIAYIIHNPNKTTFGAFHLRQAGFIHLISLALSIILVVFRGSGFIRTLVGIAQVLVFILLIIGIIRAINGDEKRAPIIGDMAQEMLSGLK